MMRAVVAFVVGYAAGRVAIVVCLLVVGLLLAGGHRADGPSPAAVQHELERREAIIGQQAEELERQADYARTPGAPAPTATFTP